MLKVNIRKQEITYHRDPSAAKQHSRNKIQGFEKQDKTHTSPLYSVFLFAEVHCTYQENKISNKQNKRCQGKKIHFKVCQEQKELCNDVGPLLSVEKYDEQKSISVAFGKN